MPIAQKRMWRVPDLGYRRPASLVFFFRAVSTLR